jgi:16S rRNA (uracil1498-N3)-methyltransferase
MQQVVISALIQSRQAWMPILQAPVPYMQLHTIVNENERRWVAHCNPGEKKGLSVSSAEQSSSDFILIGPEGDFTLEEVQLAKEMGFAPVSLGDTRLRTETAGIVAATLLRIGA